MVSRWQQISKTADPFPGEDPFDEIKPVDTQMKGLGTNEHLIVLRLPDNDQVSSNVRRISVSTRFLATLPTLEIEVRKQIINRLWLESIVRGTDNVIRRPFNKFQDNIKKNLHILTSCCCVLVSFPNPVVPESGTHQTNKAISKAFVSGCNKTLNIIFSTSFQPLSNPPKLSANFCQAANNSSININNF